MLIGAPRILDPWTVSRIETAALKRERDEIRKLGVPESWVPYVRFVGLFGPDGRVGTLKPNLAVGGLSPQRTEDELHRSIDLGLGLELQLQPGFNLLDISDVLASCPRLSIGVSSGRVHGWTALERAGEATWLKVGLPDEPLRLRHLQNLKQFTGLGATSVPVAENPSLISLEIDAPRWPKEISVQGKLARLVIENAQRLQTLPHLSHPSALRALHVSGAKHFDAASITVASNLQVLHLTSIGTLDNGGELSRLLHLNELDLSGTRNVPGAPDVLAKLAPEGVVTISENYLVSSSELGKLATAATRWDVGSMIVEDDEFERSRFAFDEDGVDSGSFAPILVRDRVDPSDHILLELPTLPSDAIKHTLEGSSLEQSVAEALIIEEISRTTDKLSSDDRMCVVALGDSVIVDVTSFSEAFHVANALSRLWNNNRELGDRASFIRARMKNGPDQG